MPRGGILQGSRLAYLATIEWILPTYVTFDKDNVPKRICAVPEQCALSDETSPF